ncbi:Na-translocating system protein MpsC family protein [Solirubrobacter soli]|uniref:Na-translocating system protein MpsC family protein n=1 Tax=Solirubrobacter soli TaxID=363832 RepID=UPI0003F95684|nr:Na-translocating system protein MpsC family protein [Solirubrobacter soli]
MATPPESLDDDAVLAAITDAMVALHERYYHRPPGSAKSQFMGEDLIACVLGNVYTDVEKTLIELQRSPSVTENRSAFQIAMQHRFVAAVESASGRRVAHFISSHHVGPDLEIELFFFEDAPRGI